VGSGAVRDRRITQGPAGDRESEAHLAGRYSIEIVDVLEDPRRAVADQILASPTVVRRLPKPIRKLVGDLADTDGLIKALELGR
jgi:circadian clock protein KaiB